MTTTQMTTTHEYITKEVAAIVRLLQDARVGGYQTDLQTAKLVVRAAPDHVRLSRRLGGRALLTLKIQ